MKMHSIAAFDIVVTEELFVNGLEAMVHGG